MSKRSALREREAELSLRALLPSLLGLAIVLTGQRADAEDLVQDTLATVIAKWDKVKAADNIDAYVRRTMVNTMLSARRRRWRTEIVSSVTAEQDFRHPPSPDVSQDVAARDAVLTLIRSLPPRQRAVLGLRYYADLPDAEIAAVLGCTCQAVRSAAHTALRSLRAVLSRDREVENA